MRLYHLLLARLRSLLCRRRREADLSEELRLHLAQQTDAWIARGLDPEQARLRARREFGPVEAVKEECRDARGTAAVDHLRRDVHHAARRLARDWRFTAAAVLVLGLGIGATTAVFSGVNAVLFRGSPAVDPERLVEIYQNRPDGLPGFTSYPAFRDMEAYPHVFAGLAAVSIPTPVDYGDRGAVRTAVAEFATASYPVVLGLSPSRGRWFAPAEDAPGAGVAGVVSHRAWTARFASDPAVVGRIVTIEGVPVTIVGVGPEGLDATINIGLMTDFWLPISSLPLLTGVPRVLGRSPLEGGFLVKARLRDGVTPGQAQAAMDLLGARLARDYPDVDAGTGITVLPASAVRVHPRADRLLTVAAAIPLVLVGLVLAIACSNLATLLLVRGSARTREVAVRLALGATRWQLVRHLVAESVLLAAAGGAAGFLVAWWGLRALDTIELPVAVDVAADGRVFAFTVVLSLVTGVACGLAPALTATKVDLVPSLRDDGGGAAPERRRLSLRNALVVFQMAISVALLAGMAVFVQTLRAARAQDLGYAVEDVAVIETDARYAGYAAEVADALYEELQRRIAAVPGVQATTRTHGLPMETVGLPVIVDDDADVGTPVEASSIWAGPGFFDALGIPILFGRALDARDGPGAPRAAVVSESMARRYFGTADAVGRRFRVFQDANWLEIVGVARDTGTADPQGDLTDPQPYLYFRSPQQSGRPLSTVIARTSLGSAALVAQMQRELRAIDVSLPVLAATTMTQHIEDSMRGPRMITAFVGALGATGIVLAAIGLYAVVAFAVARRTREIGIRMAIGSTGRQAIGAVAREAALLVGAGTAAGLALALLFVQGIRVGLMPFNSPPPGVAAYQPGLDPQALLAILTVMALIGLAAAVVPARRAARIDPLSALRQD